MTDYATSVNLQDPLLERPSTETSYITAKSIPISTRYGYVLVTQQGKPDRTPIVTYHDVGYNCTSCTRTDEDDVSIVAPQFEEYPSGTGKDLIIKIRSVKILKNILCN
ncbi:unnamed protein product [Adineta steineri]|uniref:Uncharacterized protein n=1 Tax=Adineta steineri TaxID=433720 RepID=A0A813Q6J5_9BILA|nr:unnamed protein product [Adineta steineri]